MPPETPGPGDHARTRTVLGWGRTRPVDASRVAPNDAASAARYLRMASATIARGRGRSYGDAAQLDGGLVLATPHFDEIEMLDSSPGSIRVGAGVTIGQLIDRFVSDGWFVPVTPGTRVVTIGGAIAADIHGKNHHVDGSFIEFVDTMRILTAAGEVVTTSRTENADLFWATAGGMGLTGIIVDADIRLAPIESSKVKVLTERTNDLAELMDRMKASDAEHHFSVAWVDLLTRGRSVLTQGRFATQAESDELERPGAPALPLPVSRTPRALHRSTVRAFNELWWRKAPSTPSTTLESITGFFHPLDAIANWHILYGAHGFLQWQIVVPDEAESVMVDIVRQIEAARAPGFFAVLKRFGAGNDAPLSFPKPGWTLALDLPAADRSVPELLHRFDEQVVEASGRVYLAKDARMRGELVPRMYPRLDEWRTARDRWDPAHLFESDLSRRLGL